MKAKIFCKISLIFWTPQLLTNQYSGFFLFVATATAYYHLGEVADLTYRNFDDMVMKSKDIWIVQFYKARSKFQMASLNLSK